MKNTLKKMQILNLKRYFDTCTFQLSRRVLSFLKNNFF